MGETVYAQFSDWVIEKRRPATRTVPVRGAPDRDCTSYATVPLPVPLAPDLMTIQLESETAVQAHEEPAACTTIVPDPPACEKLSDESPSCITQSAAACVTLAC